MSTYISLLTRAFLLAVFLAVVTVAGELLFVFLARQMHPGMPFTSFYAVVLFAIGAGFMPVWPSPSRISSTPISLLGRLLLLIEFTIFVAVAIFASVKFMAYEHVIVPIDTWFAAYAYVLILVVMLVANFGRLRREISASH